MKMWGGRFSEETEDRTHRLNASLPFDMRLYREDIDGSQAWARVLAQAGALEESEARVIVEGLRTIRAEFDKGLFQPTATDEDIHTAVERRLTELIGPAAGKLHTGRSRNDQVATDFRLWLMRACSAIDAAIADLCRALLESAEEGIDLPMPGYTHTRRAQPTTWGHWVLSHFWPLIRDQVRFGQASSSAAVMPLGSGALSGTPYPVDRAFLASELGFGDVSTNSIDAVSDRDFALEFLFAGATLGVHLSQLAEGLILFSSTEFGFVALAESYATGSSLLPQKMNPDPLELARGKAGRLIANLTGLLATLKGLPSAYDKDLQEDKEPVFDTFDTVMVVLAVLPGLVRSLTLSRERMSAALDPTLYATDLADYLVGKGLPFREAHELTGAVVRMAEESGLQLPALALDDLRSLSDHFDADVFEVFDPPRSLARRDSIGGTSPEALASQLHAAKRALATETSA